MAEHVWWGDTDPFCLSCRECAADIGEGPCCPVTSMLTVLKKAQIFSVEKVKDCFVFAESCDGWYDTVLTGAQVKQLAAELLALVDG